MSVFSLAFCREKIQTICAFLCFYYAHTKDSKTAFVLRLKQMYTSCHSTFFCKRTQFSCSQNTKEFRLPCAKKRQQKIHSVVMSKLVTSIVLLLLNSLGCGASLLVQCCWCFRVCVVWVKWSYTRITSACSAQLCSGEIWYLAVQINGGDQTLRLWLGEGSHQLVRELAVVRSWVKSSVP